MKNDDPTLMLVHSVGKLEGVISELSKVIAGLRTDMKEKINEKQGRAIATEVVAEHVTSEHKKNSTAPAATIKISGSLMKKIAWILGGAGIASGGGFGVWTFLEKIFGP